MNPLKKKMDTIVEPFENSDYLSEYPDELMLRLQPVSSDVSVQPEKGWQPGFEEIFTDFSDLEENSVYYIYNSSLSIH